MKKIIALTLFCVMVVPFSFASLSGFGTVGSKSKSSKYSLKNFSAYSKKSTLSLSIIKHNLQYNGTLNLTNNTIISNNTSLLQFGNGNTVYSIPFNYTFKVPKFKTPSPNN